jgi:hypothetical protein
MAAPIILVLASLGGIIAGFFLKRGARRQYVFASFALLPLLAAPVERGFPDLSSFRTVLTKIDIEASPEAVWREIVRVPEIREEERRTSFFHRISTPFNWYSSLWSDAVMSDIQETICRVIKSRSEASSL